MEHTWTVLEKSIMNIKDNILNSREERAKLINTYLLDYKTVISVKANMPGLDKNNHLSYLLVNAFSYLANTISNSKIDYRQNDDGPFLLIMTNDVDSQSVKNEMVEIENSHELGRLIDIDVYDKQGSFSRGGSRICYLCDDYAINCIKNNKHSFEEIIEFIRDKVYKYYQRILWDNLDSSIMEELALDPKFGLVTPYSSGSHKDMNYELMIKAKTAIIPFFIKMFFVTCEKKDVNDLLIELKNIGISAETAMFLATEGINAYKGLIFNLGLVVSGIAYKTSRFSSENIFEIFKKFAEILFKEYKYRGNSYGDIAYQKYLISGIKGEALNGFKHVQEALPILKDFTWISKIRALVFYITNIEDTSFLKRAGSIESYLEVKKLFVDLDIFDMNQVNSLNQLCIENNLSFGGSADLLVVTVFLKKINDLWQFF